jgi:hypothetical protein
MQMTTCAAPLGWKLLERLEGPGSSIVHIAWSPQGDKLAAGFDDGSAWVWDYPNRGSCRRFAGLPEPTYQLAWSPDGSLLGVGLRGGTILRCDVSTGNVMPIQVTDATLIAFSWSTDSEVVAALRECPYPSEHLAFVRLQVQDGTLLEHQAKPEWNGALVSKSADGRFVSVARLDEGGVEIWDLHGPACKATLHAGYYPVSGIANCPDHSQVVMSLYDGSVEIWSLLSGERVRKLRLHGQLASSIAFSDKGKFFASKSADGTVRLRVGDNWLRTEPLPEAAVGLFSPPIAFHPKSPVLATYDEFNTALRVWGLDESTLRLHGGGDLVPILFLSANPTDVNLKLDEELREIQDHLAFAKLRERFDLHIRPAVKPDDLIRFLTEDLPRIVHFSGHGTRAGSILTEDAAGKPFSIGAEALSNLFRQVADHVQCVVLNACYAEIQARAIAQHISYVVGMQDSISDGAAIAYSKGFYQSLGNGVSFEKAHEFGVAQIGLSGFNETQVPVLIRKGEALLPEPEPAASVTAA